MDYHLAQINIGRLVAPIDDPRIAGFVSQLAPINALADSAPGFVWRLQSESGNATDIPFSDDPTVMLNMSVWESIEALRDFTYASRHTAPLKDRAKWFEKMDKPHYCLWWVPDGISRPWQRDASGWCIFRSTALLRIPSGFQSNSPLPRKTRFAPDGRGQAPLSTTSSPVGGECLD